MDLGIQGKVALVSGASAGLGYAVARSLAQEGAQVVIASRDPERIEAAARRLSEESGRSVRAAALDVRDPDGGERFLEAASGLGPPQILITNAGGPPPSPFGQLTVKAFEDAMELTFLSVVRLVHAILPAMKESGWGRIVHIASSTVHEPAVGLFLSSSIRPAVAGFSKALAKEVARDGITVNVVSPGFIATDRLQELTAWRAGESGRTVEAEYAALGETVPVGRIGRPEELAAAVTFLSSAQAAYITGVALRVDGGRVSSLL
jgi:3-oxoacyl-[acyl-carrier protein] reductase